MVTACENPSLGLLDFVHEAMTQVRREFIDPFFKCLGWDIDNTQSFAEAYSSAGRSTTSTSRR